MATQIEIKIVIPERELEEHFDYDRGLEVQARRISAMLSSELRENGMRFFTIESSCNK